MSTPQLGDMSPDEFRRHAHRLVDWIADYLHDNEHYPVLSRVEPGEIARQLPPHPPDHGEPFDRVLDDFERTIVPGLTHWNHPGFFAYFAITGSAPGVLGEFLSAALNVQAMLWRTSPAATELEEVSLGWLRQLIGLPDAFEGVIYDTASVSSLHALAAAREAAVPGVRREGLSGRDLPKFRVYCSEHAHSSIDKAVMTLGFGHDALRRIAADAEFRMDPSRLSAAIEEDRRAAWKPLAAVATVGTTSSTSIDPVPAIAEICERERLWLHVDAAYAGVAAMIPGYQHVLSGADRADSLVVNPHKWLFTPFDPSAFFCRRMDTVRRAFALTPEYLVTAEADRVHNLMDTGIQLGRRFRALKLWMILRYFGADGLRSRLVEHIRLAQLFSGWVREDPEFELLAPAPFSVVCFRAKPHGTPEEALDTFNERLLQRLNATGEVFLSHTKLGGKFTLRLAVGHIRTEERHVQRAWELMHELIRS